MKETVIRSIIKTITWRLIATIITSVISYFITKKISYAISIAIIDILIKLVAYYLHERVWTKIKLGVLK